MLNACEIANIVEGMCPIPERVPDEASVWVYDSKLCLNVIKEGPHGLYCPLSAFAMNMNRDSNWEGEGSINPFEINCRFIGKNPIKFTFLEFHDPKLDWHTNYVICYSCRIPKQVLSVLEKRASPEYLASRTPIYLLGPATFISKP